MTTFVISTECSISVNVPTAQSLLEKIEADLRAQRGFTVATLNLDHLVKMRASKAFREAYAQQTYVVADGNPVVWLSRIAGAPVELAPGSELVGPLAALAAQVGAPVALLGATSETLDRAAAALAVRHPGLKVVAKIAPPLGLGVDSPDAAAALAAVAASGAQLCFLALGAPKQEMLSVLGRKIAPGCGFVSIGAGLDFIAGSQKRAPAIFRAVAMEWFWRMMSNPRRLAHRYLACAALMPALVWNVLASSQPMSGQLGVLDEPRPVDQ